jgi:hypothetical protein
MASAADCWVALCKEIKNSHKNTAKSIISDALDVAYQGPTLAGIMENINLKSVTPDELKSACRGKGVSFNTAYKNKVAGEQAVREQKAKKQAHSSCKRADSCDHDEITKLMAKMVIDKEIKKRQEEILNLQMKLMDR